MLKLFSAVRAPPPTGSVRPFTVKWPMHAIRENIAGLSKIVQAVCSGDYSVNQLSVLVYRCYNIAYSFLICEETRGKAIGGYGKQPESLEDMTWDCIASLFARDSNEQFQLLRRYFGHYLAGSNNPPTDEEVFISLQRIVINRTKQELVRIFAERDPEGAKILRNIKLALKDKVRFYVFSDFRGHFATLRRTSHNLREGLPQIPKEVIENRLSPNSCAQSTPALIEEILSIVSELDDCRNYLAIEDLSEIVRHTISGGRGLALIPQQSPSDAILSQEMADKKEEVLRDIRSWLKQSYIEKNKMDGETLNHYCNALREVLDHFVDGWAEKSYYEYLSAYMPNLSKEEYMKLERPRFEYIAKTAKDRLREELKKLR